MHSASGPQLSCPMQRLVVVGCMCGGGPAATTVGCIAPAHTTQQQHHVRLSALSIWPTTQLPHADAGGGGMAVGLGTGSNYSWMHCTISHNTAGGPFACTQRLAHNSAAACRCWWWWDVCGAGDQQQLQLDALHHLTQHSNRNRVVWGQGGSGAARRSRIKMMGVA